ncbi:MAG: hypothetical protein V2I48_04415 [Xanthomonadales bacterium]|jgi:hypothetical protein|nr:hypothetical protein [Xanthomonadales bacterium]
MNDHGSLAKAGLAVALAMVVFIGLTLVVNLGMFDEKPLEPVSRLMAPEYGVEPPREGNAYFALLGLKADEERDMAASGARLLERYARSQAALGDADYLEILGNLVADQAWLEAYDGCTGRKQAGCLKHFAEQIQSHPLGGERLNLLLQRYGQIIDLPLFRDQEHLGMATPLPEYSAMMKLSQLQLANSFLSGNSAAFLDRLEADIRFWRMLLDQSRSLLGKMVGLAGIWNDVSFLSEFVAAQDSLDGHQAVISRILSPLTPGELDIGESFVFEQRFFVFDLVNNPGSALRRLLLQPQATVNSYYSLITGPMLRLSSLPLEEFVDTYIPARDSEAGSAQLTSTAGLLSLSPASLYNLGGKQILVENAYSPADYVARAHDANGMIDLVKLQVWLKNQPEANWAQAVQNASIGNPYKQAPMSYDEEGPWLSFECLDRLASCRVRLR